MSRIGNPVGTYSGRYFYPIDPIIEDVDLYDIAYALSNICRFNGNTKFHYSVAQHSLLVAEELKERSFNPLIQFWGLTHDCSEAYIADIPAPLKEHLPQYLKIEEKVQDTIWEYFNIGSPYIHQYKPIQEVDDTIAHLEGKTLLNNPQWIKYKGGLHIIIQPRKPSDVRKEFVNRVLQLREEVDRWCEDA